MAARSGESSTNVEIKPSQVGVVAKIVWRGRRVPFLHGPPGIGKSEILKQQANAMGVAFIDVRLATKNPAQIAGVPFPTEIHGETGVRYSIPVEFPRDIDVENVVEITFRKRIKFGVLNPKGQNGINYCRNPQVEVSSIDPLQRAELISCDDDQFTVMLYDQDGKPARGHVLYTIVAKCRAIMCFDELTSANQSVQAVSYSLINDRRLGEYQFPDGVDVCAAGNREQDGGVHHTMVQPLRNRFVHYTLKSDLVDFLAHARLIAAYPPIIRFHEETHGKYLFVFDPASASMAWSSPRSWIMLSDIEYAADQLGIHDTVIRRANVVGAIGETNALLYIAFKNQFSGLPSAIDILKGKSVNRVKLDVPQQNFISTTMIWYLRQNLKEITENCKDVKQVLRSEDGEEFYRMADNMMAFMRENFAPDLAVGEIRKMSNLYKLPFNPKVMPEFAKIIAQNKIAL